MVAPLQAALPADSKQSAQSISQSDTLACEVPDPADKRAASDSLTFAVLSAVLGWAATSAVGWYLLRRRFQTYLVVVINTYLRQYHSQLVWLENQSKEFVEGRELQHAANYTKDELAPLTGAQTQAINLLSKQDLIRLTQLILNLSEIEALMDGLCQDLRGYKAESRMLTSAGYRWASPPLSKEDVAMLQRKVSRLLSHVRALPKSIHSIAELPVDYSSVDGAEKIIQR